MEMTNKSLALLLVAAIVISLGGTIISLNKMTGTEITGKATTGAGQVNVTISSASACVVDNYVNFGAGTPTTSRTLSTDKNNNFDGWSCDGTGGGTTEGNCTGLVINNTGNVKLNISYNSSLNGSGLLGSGHTESDFTWIADDTELEANSCAIEPTDWTNVNVSIGNGNNSNVCAYLNYTDASDVIVMDFNITVNQNTAPATKTATITIGCIQAN